MSYIRCTSNPEGLYIFGSGKGRVEIFAKESTLYMPEHVFHGLLLRWLDRREDVKYRGGAIFENAAMRWSLHYTGWHTDVQMYEVTLFYLAADNQLRWAKKPRSKR